MNPISKMIRLAVVALPAMALMACTSSIPRMNAVDMTGDDFNHHLARNYKTFSNYEYDEMYDRADAVLYAEKAMAAAAGTPTNPDDLKNRSIEGADKVAELQTARARLMQSLAAGAAQKSRANAANAQANFDCWAEQQEEGFQHDHIAACKDGFWRAMLATETAMAPAPAQRPVAQRAAPKPSAAQRAAPKPAAAQPATSTYRVFFDWDRSALTDGARELVDRAIQSSRATGHDIHLIGHTDSSGSDAYNMGLSQRRADAVTNYLVANGVARSAITSEARGERDALTGTGDGVREPQNRRVSIELTTRVAGRVM